MPIGQAIADMFSRDTSKVAQTVVSDGTTAAAKQADETVAKIAPDALKLSSAADVKASVLKQAEAQFPGTKIEHLTVIPGETPTQQFFQGESSIRKWAGSDVGTVTVRRPFAGKVDVPSSAVSLQELSAQPVKTTLALPLDPTHMPSASELRGAMNQALEAQYPGSHLGTVSIIPAEDPDQQYVLGQLLTHEKFDDTGAVTVRQVLQGTVDVPNRKFGFNMIG